MARELPRCYGSHERGHADCGICLVEDDCEIETQAVNQADARRQRVRDVQATRLRSTGTTTSTTTSTTQGNQTRTLMDHDHGFFHAVGYNSMLEAITAVFSEGWRSMREIPRLDYRNVWERKSKPPEKKDP